MAMSQGLGQIIIAGFGVIPASAARPLTIMMGKFAVRTKIRRR
jgi:hypothetical protein